MRILLTNDDGYYAPGIKALHKVLTEAGHEVWSVAPKENNSIKSHGMTVTKPVELSTPFPLKYPRIKSVTGFPADCIILGLSEVLKDSPPDLVVSGMNKGGNLSRDIVYSGTFAAAKEAFFQGFNSIALSLAFDLFPEKRFSNELYDYTQAALYFEKMLSEGYFGDVKTKWDNFYNVNFPTVLEGYKGIKEAKLGGRHYGRRIEKRKSPRGADYYWIIAGEVLPSIPGEVTDVTLCKEGYITVTKHKEFI